MSSCPILVILLSALLSEACAPSPTSAAFSARSSRWHAGTVIAGQRVSTKFEFKNVGGSPLRIVSVAPTCSCTAVAPIEREFKPGQTGSFDVTLDTAGRKGELKDEVTISTNDARNPDVHFIIEATVIGEFEPDGDRIDFGSAPLGVPITRHMTISLTRDAGILNATSTNPQVIVAWRRVDSRVLLDATMRAQEVGDHFGALVVQTSSRLTPELRIPVFGTVSGRPLSVR